jgi:hypothetical protein
VRSTPHCLLAVLVVRWGDIDGLRWVVRAVKDCEDSLWAMREAAEAATHTGGAAAAAVRAKHLEIHIFVAGTPVAVSAQGHPVPAAAHDDSFFGPSTGGADAHDDSGGGSRSASSSRSPLTCLDLYRALRNPSSVVQRLSSVLVHRGAPDRGSWAALFRALAHRAPALGDVGVILSAGPLAHCAHTRTVDALRHAGVTLEAPSPGSVAALHRTADMLRVNCAHLQRQTGKVWRMHSDLDL